MPKEKDIGVLRVHVAAEKEHGNTQAMAGMVQIACRSTTATSPLERLASEVVCARGTYVVNDLLRDVLVV